MRRAIAIIRGLSTNETEPGIPLIAPTRENNAASPLQRGQCTSGARASAAPARVSILVRCVQGVARAAHARCRGGAIAAILGPLPPAADGCGSIVKGRVDSPARVRFFSSFRDRALDLIHPQKDVPASNLERPEDPSSVS